MPACGWSRDRPVTVPAITPQMGEVASQGLLAITDLTPPPAPRAGVAPAVIATTVGISRRQVYRLLRAQPLDEPLASPLPAALLTPGAAECHRPALHAGGHGGVAAERTSRPRLCGEGHHRGDCPTGAVQRAAGAAGTGTLVRRSGPRRGDAGARGMTCRRARRSSAEGKTW